MKKQVKILVFIIIIVVIIAIAFIGIFFLNKKKTNNNNKPANSIDTSTLNEVQSLNPLLQNVENAQDVAQGLGIKKVGTYNYTGTYKVENGKYVFGKQNEYENAYELSIILFEDKTATIIPKYSTIQYLGVYYGTYSIENSILSLNLNEYKGTQQNQETNQLENVDIKVNEIHSFAVNEDKSIKSNDEICNVPKDAVFNYKAN